MLLVRNLYLHPLARPQLIVRPINEGLTKLAASIMPSSTGWVQSSVNLRTCFFFLPPLPVFCFFCFNNNNNTSLLHTCSVESFKLHSVLSHLYSSTKSNVPSPPKQGYLIYLFFAHLIIGYSWLCMQANTCKFTRIQFSKSNPVFPKFYWAKVALWRQKALSCKMQSYFKPLFCCGGPVEPPRAMLWLHWPSKSMITYNKYQPVSYSASLLWII